MKRPREASAAPEAVRNAPPGESFPLPPEDQVFFDQSLRTAVRGLGKQTRARRVAPAGVGEDRTSRAARELAAQIDHTMRLENQATGEAANPTRIRQIEEQLRLKPSLVWTLPDDL